MNTMTKTLLVALAASGLAIAGCQTNNGSDGDTGSITRPDTGMVRDTGTTPDTGSMPDTGTTPDSGTTPDTGTTPDSGTPADMGTDAGPCTSTMDHCDTCTTPMTDPLNACSSFVTGCIPFDNTRVPGWPDHVPTVTGP